MRVGCLGCGAPQAKVVRKEGWIERSPRACNKLASLYTYKLILIRTFSTNPNFQSSKLSNLQPDKFSNNYSRSNVHTYTFQTHPVYNYTPTNSKPSLYITCILPLTQVQNYQITHTISFPQYFIHSYVHMISRGGRIQHEVLCVVKSLVLDENKSVNMCTSDLSVSRVPSPHSVSEPLRSQDRATQAQSLRAYPILLEPLGCSKGFHSLDTERLMNAILSPNKGKESIDGEAALSQLDRGILWVGQGTMRWGGHLFFKHQ